MTQGSPKHRTESPALIERRIRKIANARSITLALATTFVGLAFAGAVAIRLLDEESFPSFGQAVWWALQTVTTVGYGDVVPAGATGKVIGGDRDGARGLVHLVPHSRRDERGHPASQKRRQEEERRDRRYRTSSG